MDVQPAGIHSKIIRLDLNLMNPDQIIPNKKIVHLIDRVTIGGLERVIANFIDSTQEQPITHIIVSIRDVDSTTTIMPSHIEVFSLKKKEGLDPLSHFRLWKLLRAIRPDIVHTYNLPSIEYHPVACIAGVKSRVHAEHGRDAGDPQGLNKKHNLLRRLMANFIHSYIGVSKDLHAWLIDHVGISEKKAVLIQNGINTERFNLAKTPSDSLRFAIVARISPVKDHLTLLKAFVLLQEELGKDAMPELRIVGDGDEKDSLEEFCHSHSLESVSFLGARDDIDQILASTDVFVLSSIAEGIPMTILEAMSAKTPIVSTGVGGIPEVVTDGVEGYLVEKSNPVALANAMKKYIENPELVAEHGENARNKILADFDERNMVSAYVEQYKALENF